MSVCFNVYFYVCVVRILLLFQVSALRVVSLCICKGGKTALYWAAQEGQLRAVAILLDRGADIEVRYTVSRCSNRYDGPHHITSKST